MGANQFSRKNKLQRNIKCSECNLKSQCKGLCSNHYWLINFRYKLFDLLGGKKCIQCGFDDIRALQFDHINGGGRKELDQKGYRMMVINYLKNPDIAKKSLQVLCANCNWIKKHNKDENRNRCR